MSAAGEAVLYTTVGGVGEAEYEEKRSVFLSYCVRVTSEEEAAAIIKAKKKQYADARHNVFAYLLNGGLVARYSDDGEPQGTAGVPMLEVLRKSGAVDVLVVVTRYFGGILLGAGGLARAYSHTAAEALAAAGIVTFEKYTELALTCSYADYGKVSAELPRFGAVMDGVEYGEAVEVRFAVREPLLQDVCERLREMSAGRMVPRVTGERFDHSR